MWRSTSPPAARLRAVALQAGRDLLLYVPIIALVFWFSRSMRSRATGRSLRPPLLFSVGMLVQFRLYSDPEYGSRQKAEARAEKTQTLRMRYIGQFYDAERRTSGAARNYSAEDRSRPRRQNQNQYTLTQALTSSATWIPVIAFSPAASPSASARATTSSHGAAQQLLIVLITLVPLGAAVASSSAARRSAT